MKVKPAPQPNIHYDLLFQALPDLYVLLSPEGHVLKTTDAFLEVTGTTRQITDHNFFDVFPDAPPATTALLQKAWADALEHQRPYHLPGVRLRLPDADGAPHYWHMAGKPLTNQQGEVQYILHELIEVAETIPAPDKELLYRERSEPHSRTGNASKDVSRNRSLQEDVHHAQQILDSLPLMTWTAKPDGYVNYYNKRWFEYTGATPAELHDWQWRNFIHPEDFETTKQIWLQALETGEPFENQSRWVAADGSYRWFLARGVPVHDSNGLITLWVGSHTDIEDQKQMLDALEESAYKFRFLAESIPQIVWTTDPSGYHDYFNQRWTDYTGLSLDESIGFIWRDVLHPDDYQRASERWQHSLRTGEYYEIEYRFRNGKDGSYRWFLGQAIPMRDAHGKIVKWFGTCTDIEDHKKAEEELQEKNLELERINYDLDSFVYTASHDLKLPIINMAGIFEELTRSAAFTDPDAQAMIEMFNRSLHQIHNTINDLSEVVRVQKTKARDMELVDLAELTEEIKTSIHDSLADSGTIIFTDFDTAPAIAFSRANLKSIFYNLISNAIKYRDHSRPAEIRLSTNRKGEYVELLVQDNGLGINMDKHQNKLFKLFKRFHNHVNGSGLGLYIVNRLLTNSGGYINVESKLNEGTTFYLYFKQKQA